MESTRNLDKAVLAATQAVDATPQHHTKRAARLSNLAKRLLTQYEKTKDVNDMIKAASATRKAVELTPRNLPQRAARLANLARRQSTLYKHTKSLDDINKAVVAARQAVDATPQNHSRRANRLENLVRMLYALCQHTKAIDDINNIISTARHAADAISKDNPAQKVFLPALHDNLMIRYALHGKLDDIIEGVRAIRHARDLERDNPARQEELSSVLVTTLLKEHKRTGDVNTAKEIITLAGGMAGNQQHPRRAEWLKKHAQGLAALQKHDVSTHHIKEAVIIAREAVDISSSDSPNRVEGLRCLAETLSTLYKYSGRLEDIDEAISTARCAIDFKLQDPSEQIKQLNDLERYLSTRYNHTGDMKDLEDAIQYAQKVVDDGHPEVYSDRGGWLSNLGNRLASRYERTGKLDDLDKAIAVGQDAVTTASSDDPHKVNWLLNLGNRLMDRFDWTGDTNDLTRGELMLEEATQIIPIYHPNKGDLLRSLADSFLTRYGRDGDIKYLNKAMAKVEQAIESYPADTLEKANLLELLAAISTTHYRRTKNTELLDMTCTRAQAAIDIPHENEVARAESHCTLGCALLLKYYRTKDEKDLQMALQSHIAAVEATPLAFPERASRVHNLGVTQLLVDKAEALRNFMLSSSCPTFHPLMRIKSLRQAVRILHKDEKWKEATEAIRQSKLLLRPCDRFLNREDQQHAVRQISGFAADSCSIAIRAGDCHQGLQWIELGRGLILGHLIDNRSDLSELKRQCPGLAEEYETLRWKAIRQINSTISSVRGQLYSERQEAMQKLVNCENRIRQEPGFDRFLHPQSVDELMKHADEGPIIIVNVTDIGSDAIIVSRCEVQVISLPDMEPRAPQRIQQAFGRYRSIEERYSERDTESEASLDCSAEALSWLWYSCVQPILQILQECKLIAHSGQLTRTWWIGSGIASSLPFHAAGSYGSSNFQSCLDRTIPSYIPTIKALKHARDRHSKSGRVRTDERSVLVVTMPTTPGQLPLYGVRQEEKTIEKTIRNTYSMKVLEHPRSEQVLGCLQDFDIVHFACHGLSDPTNPFESHLQLRHDEDTVDRLRVKALLDANAGSQSWVAYLSACSTAETRTKSLRDEGLQLVSAFYVAGFAHVIGSLRPVYDSTCVEVAEFFYKYLINAQEEDQNRVVAEALRSAILQVRMKYPQDSSQWAYYVHYGL